MTALRPGTAAEAGMQSQRVELIRQRAGEWAEQDNTVGLALVLARHGVVCLHEAWGQTTTEPHGRPATTDSFFGFASNGKVVTAAAAMILVQRGLLSLTRPVRFYIPEFTAPGTEDIQVHQLLTHTSGFDVDLTPPQVADVLASGLDLPPCPPNQHPVLHDMLNALYRVPPSHEPGTEMAYANENFTLIGEIVRRITGMSFGDFQRQNILEPLGMTRTQLGLTDDIADNLVWDFSKPFFEGMPSGNELREALKIPDPAGALVGPVMDYAIFAQMLLNQGHYGDARILHPASVNQMTHNQIPGKGTHSLGHFTPEAGWGYGVNVMIQERWAWSDGSLPGNGSFTHGGGGGTSFWVDPELDIVGVYGCFCPDIDPATHEHRWDLDLFQNMATAAVEDAAL